MKRKSIIISLLALLLIFPILAQAAPVGKFTSIEGNVDVTAPGKEAVPANLGDLLNVGDIIRTKSKSKCEVTFIDGNILRLAESTRLRITEYMLEKEQRSAILNLFRGKIQNIVKTIRVAVAAQSKYEIHTPTAVCGIRGTNFFVYHQAGVSGAIFKEGTGYSYSLNRPQDVRTINPGQAMVVTSPDEPPVVRPATALELNQHEKDTAPAEKPKEEAAKKDEKKPDEAVAKADEGKKEGKVEEKAPAAAPTAEAPKIVEAAAAAALREMAGPVEIIAREKVTAVTPQPPPTTPYVPQTTTIPSTKFSATFDASAQAQLYRALPGNYYEGGYYQYDPESMIYYYHEYDFEYVKTSGKGMGNIEDDYAGLESYYFPDGTRFKIFDDFDIFGNDLFGGDEYGRITRSAWDINSIEEVKNLPVGGFWDPSDPTFAPDEYSVWVLIDVLEQRPYDTFAGILGSTGYPWDTGGASLTVIGEYIASDYKKPTVFRSGLSGNFLTPTGDINGAYAGFMGGFLADDARGVQGRVYGVYIGHGDATAGVLTGSYTGSLYSGIGMWDATGKLSATPMNFTNNPFGVTKDTLSGNLIHGNMLSEMMGYFKSGTSPVSGSIIGTMVASGDTLSIKGQDWGVYNATFWAGGYGMPSSGYTDWSAQIAGIGQFGEYQGSSLAWPDTGVCLVPINGTLTGGVVAGSATDGKFMTMTKMGTISADLLGIYTPPATIAPNTLYSWQGLAGGVWKKTQYLTFSSDFWGRTQRFAVQRYGIYYPEGTTPNYYYWYYTDVNEGEITFNNGTNTTVRMYRTDEGPFGIPMWEEFTYDNTTKEVDPGSYKSGTTDDPSSFNDAFFKTLANSKGYPDPTYTGEWSGLHQHGDFSAIMGGVGDLWSATLSNPATIYFLGEYDNWSGQPQLFATDIVSENVKNNTFTTLDGNGAYTGYIGGIEKDGAIEGGIYAIYLNKINDTSSKAGILKSNFTGTAYQDMEMWEGAGSMYPVYLMDVAIPPVSLIDNVLMSDFYFDSYSGNVTLNSSPMGVGETYNRPFESKGKYMGLYGDFEGGWGVWQSTLGGVYSGITMGDTWSASYAFIDSTRIIGQEATGTKWSGNKIEGTTIGYGADINNPNIPATWVSVGEVVGTFNPNLYTFQTGSMGAAIETNTFLALAATETEQAKLQQLNIPAIQVGMATLSGSGNNLNVTMNNVKFFALSTGGKPQVWATNGVGGSYTSAPAINVPVTLNSTSGGSLSADFTVKQWGSGTWLSTVNGSGTLSGGSYTGSTEFKGAGAGIIYDATTFGGTAAGVAK